MTDRERRQQTRREEEDAVFNRMLLRVGGAAVAELLVLGIQKVQVDMVLGPQLALILNNIFMVFSFLGIALAIACGYWMVRRLQAGQPIRGQAILLVVDVFLYRRVFFVSSLFTALGLSVLWIYRTKGDAQDMHRALYALIVLMVAACVGCYLLSKKEGKLFGLRVLPYDTMYPVLYVSAIVDAVAFVAVRLAGPGAAIYLIFALAAWFFAQVVYFTVKIM